MLALPTNPPGLPEPRGRDSGGGGHHSAYRVSRVVPVLDQDIDKNASTQSYPWRLPEVLHFTLSFPRVKALGWGFLFCSPLISSNLTTKWITATLPTLGKSTSSASMWGFPVSR